MFNDKVHDKKTEEDKPADVDVDSIFDEHTKRRRKNARKDDGAATRAHNPLPPPKRRKYIFKQKCTKGLKPDRSDENSLMTCSGKTDSAPSSEEQKQVDSDSSMKTSSDSLPSNLFSIFHKPKTKCQEPEQGKPRGRKKKSNIPPNFKYTKLSEHFRPI